MDTWIWADYAATALFTLKPATATPSGGKTLLIPTPFAIKMALLDVVCRVEGRATGEAVWPTIRDWSVAKEKEPAAGRAGESFGSLVFNDAEQQKRLPKAVYHALRRTITHGEPLDASAADAVARAAKDWATADRIRDAIAAAGITLEDSADGTHWSTTHG